MCLLPVLGAGQRLSGNDRAGGSRNSRGPVPVDGICFAPACLFAWPANRCFRTRAARGRNSSKTTSIYGKRFAPFPVRQILLGAHAPEWGIFWGDSDSANRPRTAWDDRFRRPPAPDGPFADWAWRHFSPGNSIVCSAGIGAERIRVGFAPPAPSPRIICRPWNIQWLLGFTPLHARIASRPVMRAQPKIRPGDPT
jgi:hypothetical protein